MNIEKVENFTEKSFKNYTGPEQYFKEKILFLDIMVEENLHQQKVL